jgi:hypothetical protein
MHVIDAAQHVEQGAGGAGGNAAGGGGADAAGGGSCDAPDDGGTRTGDAREIRDMTHDEAVAWCNNYLLQLSQFFGGPYNDMESIFAGYVVGGVGYCWAVDACIVVPSVDNCVKNLLHAPCEARITELNTCLANLGLDDNFADQSTCGAGCETFMRTPHCSETVISKIGPPVADGAGGADECYLRTSKGCR